jgi:hypothetical protein
MNSAFNNTDEWLLSPVLFNGSVLPTPDKVLAYPLSQEIHNPREED